MTQMQTICTGGARRVIFALSAFVACVLAHTVAAISPVETTQATRADTPEAGIVIPEHPQPILPLDQVRVGMKGYGLTVFHGQAIEPFPVEVVSVQHDFGPQRGVIWIRCPDERMQLTGPVSGMSGSPIYLWDDWPPSESDAGSDTESDTGSDAEPDARRDLRAAPREIGHGGKLIGAFAFGYNLSKDCYVGVQPIEQMRRTGARLADDGASPSARTDVGSHRARQLFATQLQALLQTAPDDGVSATSDPYWRVRMIASMLERQSHGQHIERFTTPTAARTSSVGGAFATPQALRPLALPLTMPGTVSSHDIIARLVEPLGLLPLEAGGGATAYTGGAISGSPPPNVDPDTLRMEPGSVLSVPLAWGDLDLAAAGTVTDVLPDGSVLGFGHAFQGIGPIAMPMATGFVHFIQPNLSNSFKLSGSGQIVGTLARDEPSAVAGRPGVGFETAPVNIDVHLPGREPMRYRYTAVRDQAFMPTIVTVLAMQSAAAEQAMPPEHTLIFTGKLRLPGGRVLTIGSQTVMGGASQLVMDLFPVLGMLATNAYQSVLPEAVDLKIEVIEEVRSLELTHLAVAPQKVAPGEVVTLAVRLQPYLGEPIDTTIKLRIPDPLPDGDYELAVSDAMGYERRLVSARRHLMESSNLEEMLDMLDLTSAIPGDALYVTLTGQNGGVAVGREELPSLPSSRMSMIASDSQTLAAPFGMMHTHRVPVDGLPEGMFAVDLMVRADPLDEH